MADKTGKTLSPMNVRTEKQLLSLRRDNTTAGDFWMMADEYTVTLCEQRIGEGATASVKIPRVEFNKLLRWYMRPQKMEQSR